MAYRIFKKGNYIHIVDTVTLNLIEENASEVFISKATQASTNYNISLKRSESLRNIPLSDIQDEAGVAYIQAAWETFYQANTGFNPATANSAAQVASDLSAHQSSNTPHASISIADTGLSIHPAGNPTRLVQFDIDADQPVGTMQIQTPRTPGRLTIRENVPDFTNLSAPESTNFTATWGSRHPINATAGNVVVYLPSCDSTNQNLFINLTRVDNSANTVTVVAPLNQPFFDSYIQAFEVFTMKKGSTVNIRSLGTVPVITNINGVLSVQRLWLPTDASAAPVILFDFSNLASLTLNGSTVSAINNLGTLGATHNLAQATGTAQPTINNIISPQYATFDGGDVLLSGSVESMQNGTIGSMAALYTQPSQISTSVYSQAPATGGQLNFHPKWGDGVTYLDMPITSARVSGNVGTAFGGDANPYAAVGIRNGANVNLYSRGNQTASLTSASASGTSTGNAIIRLGDTAQGTGKHVGRIYKLLYYRIALTNDERDRIGAYMLWSIGQQALLNASNPFVNAPPTILLTTY